MQLISTLSVLAVVNLVTAIPAPSHEMDPDKLAELLKITPWYMTGYESANCEGSVLWNETDSTAGCRDVPAPAASYRWGASQKSIILTWPEPQLAHLCYDSDHNSFPENWKGKLAGPKKAELGTMVSGCVTTPVHGFYIEQPFVKRGGEE